MITAIDTAGNPVAGVELAHGSSSWSFLCDRNGKANFAPVDRKEILDRMANLPITRWNYKGQSPSIQHIGPTAQDFYAAFNLGESERSINMVDAEGVVIAAIQSLYKTLQEKERQIDALQSNLDRMVADSIDQRQRIERMEARFANLNSLAHSGGTIKPVLP